MRRVGQLGDCVLSHVRYIDKTREYYLAEGYDEPYRWAHFETVPFALLGKPLDQCRLTLVSTCDIAVKTADAAPIADQFLVGGVYSIDAATPADRLYSRQDAYDRYATNLDDVNSFFPITRCHELAAAGRVGGVASRLHGVRTSYSQRRTLEIDGPEVLRRCREDGVDAVILTPI